jgi:dipeptidyl aminopeptidase/acylaminoacyl peptidase
MAGNIVLRSLAARPQIPAAVIWAGAVYSYTDLSKYRLNDQSYRPPTTSTSTQRKRQELFDKYGQFENTNPFWKLVAPTNYLGDLKGAIQLNHANDDDVVDIGYSNDFNSLLDKTEVHHELKVYPSGGHNISGVYFSEAMKNTVDFFKKYLK